MTIRMRPAEGGLGVALCLSQPPDLTALSLLLEASNIFEPDAIPVANPHRSKAGLRRSADGVADSRRACRLSFMTGPGTAAPNIVTLPTAGFEQRAVALMGGDMVASGLSAVLIANRAPLLRFLRARGAGEDAEDILQELWLKVERLAAEGPIADPRAYLFRMADNLMHDRVRASMRRGHREQAWSEAGYDPAGRDETPSPERALAARQKLRRVELALATLGERSQSIFRRFRIDGVTQSRIAQEEGISVSAVEKHLQRAYRVVAALAGEEDEAAPVSRSRTR
jgi:RNA polymerase sigma-70 factor (ECF subfamily)